MPVSPRSLRRAHPDRYRAGAAVVAAAVGAATAAWGVLHVVERYEGNGARSDARSEEQVAPSPTELLLDPVVKIVSEVPGGNSPSWLAGFDPLVPGSLVISVLSPGQAVTPTVPGPGTGGPTILPPVPPPSGLGVMLSDTVNRGGKDTGVPGVTPPPTGPDGLVCPAPITAPVQEATPAPDPLAPVQAVVDQAVGCPAEEPVDTAAEEPDEAPTAAGGTTFGHVA